MTWLEHHSLSERYASDAQTNLRLGNYAQARGLYAKAAKAEKAALGEVAHEKRRTYSITAVSAVALHFKAAQWDEARLLAYKCLGSERLMGFAFHQIEDLIDSIKFGRSIDELNDAQMLVSVKGGAVSYGGAPMDLLISKFEGIESMLYRTVEYMKELPCRKKGNPASEIRSPSHPWLFHAEPGSYRFLVDVSRNQQNGLLDGIEPDQVTSRLFEIMRTCAESPNINLPKVVPDEDYRGIFLKLTRDLAPRGDDFTQIGIGTASNPTALILDADTRDAINEVIKAYASPSDAAPLPSNRKPRIASP